MPWNVAWEGNAVEPETEKPPGGCDSRRLSTLRPADTPAAAVVEGEIRVRVSEKCARVRRQLQLYGIHLPRPVTRPRLDNGARCSPTESVGKTRLST